MKGSTLRLFGVPAEFEAVSRTTGRGILVDIRGELDLANASELTRVLDGVVASRGPHVVLDLSELEFIDACGIRVIERARDRLNGQGRTCVVRNPRPIVRRVLGICGLDDWLEAPEEIVFGSAEADRATTTALPAQTPLSPI